MGAIRAAVRGVRESLLVVPFAIIVLCGVLAALLLRVDAIEMGRGLPAVPVTVEGARSILSALAGATITVAAIVFSITALSTQIAANQYTPRSVRGFFEDGFQQSVIGFTIGTFTYALIVLAGLGYAVPDPGRPFASLSVTVGILMGVVAVIAIVAYIDHSLRRMQIDVVIRRIADRTLASIRHDRGGEDPQKQETTGKPPDGEPAHVLAEGAGWVQHLDVEKLLRVMPPRVTARVDVRRGEAVAPGDHILTLWGFQPPPAAARRLRAAIRLGRTRSIEADPHFGVRQLVDIALRALSPGINDPTTALDIVHQLKIPVREILLSQAPGRVRTGPEGRRVFLAANPSVSDLVHDAFREIRLAAGAQPAVVGALLEVMADLVEEVSGTGYEGRTQPLLEEARLTVEAIRGSLLPEPDVERALVQAKRLPA